MQFSESDIQRVVLFVLMDSLRMIERLGQPQYAKYAILMQSILTPLFTTGLVKITEIGLEINIDIERFEKFLEILRDLLLDIKELYLLEPDVLSKKEKPIIDTLNIDSKQYTDYIARKIGVTTYAE